MLELLIQNRFIFYVCFAAWLLLFLSSAFRPQHFRNSFFLMFALLMTVMSGAALFGDNAGTFLIVVFILVSIVLFLVPAMLVYNGIVMIKKEGRSLAHLLSLFLGIFVGFGEIAVIWIVLRLGGGYDFSKFDSILYFIGMSVFYISSVILSFVLYVIFIQIMPHRMKFDYIIIHGAGLLDGDRISKLFASRIDKAISVYKRCKKKPMIIASGGQGEDESISEGEAMYRYLAGHGIPYENIIIEGNSKTTRENLMFSKDIIVSREKLPKDMKKGIPLIKRNGKGPRVALVSSNYHIYRCLSYSSKIGMDCVGIGAKVAAYFWASAVIREFIAIFTQRLHMIVFIAGYLIAVVIPTVYMFFN